MNILQSVVRFYDELDYERRVRKRRTKLISSCEDAFTHVRKCFNDKYGAHIPMDAREAAQVRIINYLILFHKKSSSRLYFLPCHVHFKNIFE
jgi:hypothetical protein